MAKLTDYTNPLSGQKGNIFDLKGLWSMILGVFVFLFVFSAGEKLAGKISGRVPMVSANPTNPFAPQATVQVSQKRIV